MKTRTKVLGIVSILGSFFVSISGTLPKSGSTSNANLNFANSTIGGYIKDGDNKKQIVSFASTVTGDDVSNITEYGIKVYSDSGCSSVLWSKSSSNITHLISKEGRFYTVIGDDEEISKDTTYYAKAYAVVGGTTYSSNVMNAKGNDNKEYTFSGTYQISVSAGTGGTVTGSGNYSSGDSCTVVATPSTGYTFDGWYENDIKIEDAEASYTFTVSASRTLTAKFTPNTYTITTTVTNGSYSGDTSITYGSSASVTITPSTNYKLPSSITVSGATYTYDSTSGLVSLSNPTDNVTISCTCAIKTYSVSTSVSNCSASGATSINAGGTAKVTLTASAGYNLPSSITVSGASYSYSSGVVTLSNPTGNVSITGSATAKTLTPTLNAVEGVTGEVYSINLTTSAGTSIEVGKFNSESTRNYTFKLLDNNNNLIGSTTKGLTTYDRTTNITISDANSLKNATSLILVVKLSA